MSVIGEAGFARLRTLRATDPAAFARARTARARRRLLGEDGRLFIVAADHPARGALAVGSDAAAMADRHELLERLATALVHPVSTVCWAPRHPGRPDRPRPARGQDRRRLDEPRRPARCRLRAGRPLHRL
ncbi:hypothetical protein [Microbacterium sp. NIBRBAC000506063]|uniref:Cgl0159 family (beta/alpha)8-fold protein n=1 Tax=Microbacterium sp. NIBRBAC000506063 TaxID=2734618 RepID=UPI0039813EED